MAQRVAKTSNMFERTTKLKAVRVSIDNRPGALALAARALADEGVNIEGVETEVLGQFAFFRFFTPDWAQADRIMRAHGYVTTITDILEVLIPNKPGEIARVCETLAKGNINVETLFGATFDPKRDGRFFLRVNDIEKAQRLLAKAQFHAYSHAH